MEGVRRAARELAQLEADPSAGVALWPVDEANVLELEGIIDGAAGTPFESGRFRVALSLPTRYPFEPPKARFITKVYHPNIDSAGRICLDTLVAPPKGSWKPSVSLRSLLLSLQALLSAPNPADALVPEIAQELLANPAVFETKARDWTRRLASSKKDEAASPLPSPTPPPSTARQEVQLATRDPLSGGDAMDLDEPVVAELQAPLLLARLPSPGSLSALVPRYVNVDEITDPTAIPYVVVINHFAPPMAPDQAKLENADDSMGRNLGED